MAPETTIDDLDESKLSGENGEMHLFQWLSSVEKALNEISIEVVKSKQSDLEATLVKVITSPDGFPSPGRALRNGVARCLSILSTRGETRSLFDNLGVFLKIVAEYKVADKDTNKIAAFYCVGELMGVFGSQFMSYMAEIATTSLKTFKSSSSPLLRFHALAALRKSLTTARKAVTDPVSKDIFKQMKYGLNDKVSPVQRAAADVLVVMYSSREDITLSDVESVVNGCTKSLENADQITRRSLSRLVGHILSLTQVEQAAPPPESSQKNKKDKNEGDGDDVLPTPTLSETVKKTLLSPNEMLAQISTQFNKPHASRKSRIGMFDFYVALLSALGSTFVESNYSLIVGHFMADIVSNPRSSTTRYDVMLVRNLVGIVLRALIGVRMLSEQAQIAAIQELSNSYLKRWPAMMPGQVAPSPAVLVIILKEVAELVQQLGNTPPPVQDALAEPLVTLLAHPNHTVRVASSWALRCFCYSTPLQLPKIIIVVMEMLQRDVETLLSPVAPSDINLRALGHAYGLAALVSVIPERPLYVSYDISAKVLDMAIQLLKRAGDHDVKVADVEVEVAWISIASLMSLGPNFVRPHLPQLLVLWRNALPKPTSKDAASGTGRSAAEWTFLLHVRESALGAILCFLRHNSTPLVTLDVARRIASLLTNALLFANSFLSQGTTDPMEPSLQGETNFLPLRSREALLRRRIYQCFTALGFSSISETTQTTLLQSAVSLFAGPNGYTASLQAAIASSSGTFTSIWQSVDGYAYGITYIDILDSAASELNRDSIEMSIDAFLRKPVIGAREHDPLSLFQSCTADTDRRLLEPPPSATAVVDAAIDLFAQLLPLQDIPSTSRILSLLIEFVNSAKLEKTAGRKAAVVVNTSVALVLFLRHASVHHVRHARETLADSQITSTLSAFLKDALIDGDTVLRFASSEAIGRIASLAGTPFLTSQIKSLVDQVVNNRDPHGRAGCALAFGAIYGHVGGLAAGPLLKTTVNILMSLSNDPHPIVHFWALNALGRVINAASLAYAPFVSSTLGMLLKVYLLESHELEGGSHANANISGDSPAYPIVCRIIDAVITILGPDIQESPRTRTLVLSLVHEFSMEDDEGIVVEAIKCIQHFLMFAPEYVQIPQLVDRFRTYLSSSRRPLKLASINALYQLVQRDALSMSKLGGDRLVEDLFGMLDDDSSVEGVRNVISSWLQQTVIYNPSAWIDLCQRIMSRTTASQQVVNAVSKQGGPRDDEGESLSLGTTSEESGATKQHLTSRWRTQLFSLQCLHEICTIVAQSGRTEHLDIPFARKRGISTSGLLVTRVPDLIRMAFTASTAYVTEIRLEGLLVLQDVIQIFSKAPDPAYEEALLLEQHQAPITAALTPAFSSDATPEILASAIQACAIFVGCGIVKDINRMGRTLKLLTAALEQSKDSGMMSLGDAGELSPNASAMLRISTLSAWAQLQTASAQQSYLLEVVNPHRAVLSSLWVASLRDYATVRADSEFVNDASSTALDSSYSSLGKEVLLPYYVESWPVILQAVATSMQAGDKHILAAMDGRELAGDGDIPRLNPKSQDQPSEFFFMIFGLVYEALVTSSSDSASTSPKNQVAVLASLHALKCLVRPEYSGKALLESTTFDEFISLCYRIAMTETATIQIHLIEVVALLATIEGHKQDVSDKAASDFSLSSARAHCLKICAYIIRRSKSSSRDPAIQGDITDRIKMIITAFEAICTVGSAASISQQEDVRAIGVLLYSELLQDETSEIDLAGPTLPALKTLLSHPISTARDSHEKYRRLVHGLLSACLTNVDEMRGRHGVVSTRKIKNNLLAAVLILTVIPPKIKLGQGVIEHCCFLISEKLLEASEVSLTASHCVKTLIAAATSGNMLLHQCTRMLLPALIEYIAKMVPLMEDGCTDESLAAISEVWKAFSGFFASVPDIHRARALSVILPSIILLLRTPESKSSTLHSQTVAQLMSYATSSPSAFKDATTKLDLPTRELLEQSIRRHVQSTASTSTQQASKPQISLRSF